MKKVFIFLLLLYPIIGYSQQALSSRLKFQHGIKGDSLSKALMNQDIKKLESAIKNAKGEEKIKLEATVFQIYKAKAAGATTVVDFSDVTNWAIFGIGNLNTEAFENINAGGKISGYKRIDRSTESFTTLYFSFNKNATNNDSLLAGTFLFPDIGNSSVALTLEHTKYLGRKGNTFHLFGPFAEFSHKNIKVGDGDTARRFATLNYTVGVKYHNWTPGDDMDVSFVIAPYVSIVNVPDEDNDDYQYLFKSPNLKSEILSLGIRFIVQFNNFQAFADLRQVLGSVSKIPVRELRGFNSNIGIVFNADIVER